MRREAAGDLVRTVWETSYPTAPYLVSFAASNYSEWEETYRTADRDSIHLQYFAYPEDEAAARADFSYALADSATSCLTTLEERFGPYPFRDRGIGYEKLGIAEVPWGSLAMEHQTCISLGDAFVQGQQQRVGDRPRGRTPVVGRRGYTRDIGRCLAERGFATYSEALHVERLSGASGYRRWMGFESSPQPRTI
jgi:hypothetical protein